MLEQGLLSHRVGNLGAAEEAYVKASESDPRNPDALNLRGVVALSTGRPALAVTLMRKAATLQPDNPSLWGNLGNALFATGDFAESQTAFRRAARLDPENPDFSIGIANALAATGNSDGAATILLAVVKRRPDRAAAWFNLGKLAETSNQPQQAIECYQRALQADPNYGNAHLNLGVVLQSMRQLDDAEKCYRAALACDASRETAFINLVSILILLGVFTSAEQIARTAIAEFPRSSELHRLLSAAFMQQGRLDAALLPAQIAGALDPSNEKLQMSIGGLLFESGSPEQGLAALEEVRRAHPDDVHIAYVVGITHLTAGYFDLGWPDFVYREIRRAKTASRPWLRTNLRPNPRGQSVRLIREQGLGDELFFLRYAPLLKALGAEVVYVTDPKLRSILDRASCLDEVIEEPADGTREQVLRPDESINAIGMLVGDLPRALYQDFGEHCSDLPPPLPLTALPERVATIREKLSALGPPPYLALTWRGGVAPHEQKGKWWTLYKNIGLDAFGKTLAGLPHTLLAVQRKPLPDEILQLSAAAGAPIHDLCGVNDDLEEMLALLAVVDEYVGVSNTNMHLRAGLGRSACVLVPRPSEWRWMAHGEHSPWFPQFSVFRQGIDGTWHEALDRLRAELR